MAGTSRKESLRVKTAHLLNIPGEVVAGIPRMELIGNREFRMENHKGILLYGDDEIHISGGKQIVKVHGSELEIRAMNGRDIFVAGYITGVELN